MTILGSSAALFLKKASDADNIKRIITNYNIYAGISLYIIAAIINIYILSYLDYSTVLPLTSLTYIWTMILSHFIIKEKMTIQKILGAIGVVIGAILISN